MTSCHRFEEHLNTQIQRKKIGKHIVFGPLCSVCSASAFPLNSQICGQIFRRSRASAFRTNSRALQKKNPQIFVLPARKSEDFWSEWRDSNPRPLGPEPSAIPNFATPRICLVIIVTLSRIVKHFFCKAVLFAQKGRFCCRICCGGGRSCRGLCRTGRIARLPGRGLRGGQTKTRAASCPRLRCQINDS